MVEYVDPHDDFLMKRGVAKDTRSPSGKPYSAASYSAQYGIPKDDCEMIVARAETHFDALSAIARDYLNDPEFRMAALEGKVRPYDKRDA